MAALAASQTPVSQPSADQDHGRDVEDQDPALYCTDEFRIYYMKVLPCSKRYCHDWTTCPFAHPGEKARRRDPRTSSYTGIACPDMKKDGVCVRGELCPYAHNVFEYWLHPTRYRTQLCNDGTGCKRRVCFFAHTLSELRVPSSKPFVNPQALAAASAAAGARRSGSTLESLATDIARMRGGQAQTAAGAAGAADLANRLASLQFQQQAPPQQQQQHHHHQQQGGDQNTAFMQILSTLLQQKQQQAQQQQHMVPPPGLGDPMPGPNQLAALYQTMGASGGPFLQQQQQQQQQQQAPHQQFDPNMFNGMRQEDIAAALAQSDPQMLASLGMCGFDKPLPPDGQQQRRTPRSSLDMFGGAGVRSEYTASSRSSFDMQQACTPRTSFDMHNFNARRRSSLGERSGNGYESSRSSFDMMSGGRPSLDAGRGGAYDGGHPGAPFLQDVSEYDLAPGGQLGNAASGPAPFVSNGGYLLPCANAAAASAAIANDDSGGFLNGAFDQRSSSLPTHLPAHAPHSVFQTMPGLPEGIAYSGGVSRDSDLRRVISDGPYGYNGAANGSSDALPPRPPNGRRSLDAGLDSSATSPGFQQHLMGALPGSFNSGTFSTAGERGSLFQDSTQGNNNELARLSSSSRGSGGSLFANQGGLVSPDDVEVSQPLPPHRASSAQSGGTAAPADLSTPPGLNVSPLATATSSTGLPADYWSQAR